MAGDHKTAGNRQDNLTKKKLEHIGGSRGVGQGSGPP